jgi:hypothetical protein
MTVKYNLININGFDVPATFHDAIFKIKDGFQKGMISFYTDTFCVTHDAIKDKNVFSAVGYLLTRKQRMIIDELQLSDGAVLFTDEQVIKLVGEANLSAMLGMTLKDASDLKVQFEEISEGIGINSIEIVRQNFNKYLNNLLARPNYENPALVYA